MLAFAVQEIIMSLQLDQASVARVSFPDCAVMRFDLTQHQLSIVIGGVFIEGRGFSGAPCEISLFTDACITARTYDMTDWKETEPSQAKLGDICEWDVNGTDLKVRGFSTISGHWTEVVIPAFSGRLGVAS